MLKSQHLFQIFGKFCTGHYFNRFYDTTIYRKNIPKAFLFIILITCVPCTVSPIRLVKDNAKAMAKLLFRDPDKINVIAKNVTIPSMEKLIVSFSLPKPFIKVENGAVITQIMAYNAIPADK